MNAFHQPDLPAPAKVLSLVRLHHGLPSQKGEEIPLVANASVKRLSRQWRAGARLNHLQARRRRIALEEIPESALPAVLELGKGSNFVILLERNHSGKGEDESFLVQFPDSRESMVRGDRLRELYDGVCVFLRPDSRVQPPGSDRPARRFWGRFREISWKRGVLGALIANLTTLLAAAGLIYAFGSTSGSGETPRIPVAFFAIAMAGLVSSGLVLLRRNCGEGRLPGAVVDAAFLPVHSLLAGLLAGWVALPFLIAAVLLGAGILASPCAGKTLPALTSFRSSLLTLCFLSGAALALASVTMGYLAPALLAGSLVLGTSLIDRLFDGDLIVREWRLARLSGR
ncbi:MAG: hypothetical protein KDN18_07905 [Verrucomicrobiae bacterium]|nr:hypothetical protein [Verrucomicrobiae bacterium]